MKFDMCFKNIENMQFNGQIFKICSNVNLFSESCSLRLQLSLWPNFILKFDPLNNILGPYKQKEKFQEKLYLTKILKEMQLATKIMRLSCNDFKIRKCVKGNCKTLCVCVCVRFFCRQYMKFILLDFV